jgi:transcriptional regulator with XRE-family HTH domain
MRAISCKIWLVKDWFHVVPSSEMIRSRSLKRTTVAVLRQELQMSVEEFARLINRSPSTIEKLESGLLALSEELAFEIAKESGIAVGWLLEGNPKIKPYRIDPADDSKITWSKEIFELVQASKGITFKTKTQPAPELIKALMTSGRWFQIYSFAVKNDKTELAVYLLERFLDQLAKRIGELPAEHICTVNQKARITAANGTQWALAVIRDQITFTRIKRDPGQS